MALQADELNGLNPYEGSLPERIVCHVPLQVKNSSIEGAGRAVVVKKKVLAGEPIFNIPNPLVAVPDFEDGLKVCDQCFAHEELGAVMTVSNEGTKFSACKQCKTVLYCNEKCQRDAWKNHHKFECGFRKVFAKAPALRLRVSGLTQRLAFMRANNKISDQEWIEIRTMFRGQITQDLGEQAQAVEKSMNDKAIMFASHANDSGKRELDEEDVRQLGIAMANYAWTAHVPVFGIDGGCTLEGQLPAQLATGWFFDPFPALINHSCEPNAFYFCNGKEMVATALEDIEAGEELSYSYNYEPICDYTNRRELLSVGFGFDCTCKLCQKGNVGPKGSLWRRLRPFIDENYLATSDDDDLEKIEDLIEDLRESGFDLESGHILHLQKCIAKIHISSKNFLGFLKAYLTIFTIAFNIRPTGSPHRFFGTRWALTIMNPFLQANRPEARLEYWRSKARSTPEEQSLVTTMHQIWLQLLETHVADLARFYRDQAPIVEVAKLNLRAKQRLEKEASETQSKDVSALGSLMGGLSMKDSARQDLLVANVNKLLKWAELPTRTREEILGE